MDDATIAAYDRTPEAYVDGWEAQPAPDDLHELVERFFSPGPTADVGCGGGRDTAWLAGHGFAAVGYDASPGLLAEARRRHPGVAFEQAELPELVGVPDGHFANVLCETVIMHLEAAAVGPAVARLVEILQPGGTLYLTWRVTADADRRDEAGRLYAAFDAAVVADALAAAGATIVHRSEGDSASSGKVVHRVVARKPR